MEIKINNPINNIISFLAIAPVLQITKDNDIGEKIIKKRLPNKYITTIPHVIELNIPCKNKYDIR